MTNDHHDELVIHTVQLLKIVRKYTDKTKNGPTELKDLIHRLVTLKEVLERLYCKLHSSGNQWSNYKKSALAAIRATFQFRLEQILSHFKPPAKTQRRGFAVGSPQLSYRPSWPFNSPTTQEIVVFFDRYIGVFSFTLEPAGRIILNTPSKVLLFFQRQCRFLKSVRKIFRALPDIRLALDEAVGICVEITSALILPGLAAKDVCEQIETLELSSSSELGEIQENDGETCQSEDTEIIPELAFHEKHSRIFEKHLPKTGTWLFESADFKSWRDGEKYPLLWCKGMPGSGKTVLTSVVIDHLNQHATGGDKQIAYIYFDYQDRPKMTVEMLLSKLIMQLLTPEKLIFSKIRNIFINLHKRYSHPGYLISENISFLRLISQLSSRTYVIVDAIDDINNYDHERDDVKTEFLNSLLRLSDVCRIFLTSRPSFCSDNPCIPAISKVLKVYPRDADISTYILFNLSHMKGLRSLIAHDSTIAVDIIKTIKAKSSGSFLLLQLQMAHISLANSTQEVRRLLDSLPNNLDDMYKLCLKRILDQPPSQRYLGLRTISWISRAKRPLSDGELLSALAFRYSASGIEFSVIDSLPIIMEACAGLLSIEAICCSENGLHYQDVVTFSNSKVYEFINSQQWIHQNTDQDMANTCLQYLVAVDRGTKSPTTSTGYPFRAYASQYWVEHAAIAEATIDASILGKITQHVQWQQEASLGLISENASILSNSDIEKENIPLSFALAVMSSRGSKFVLQFLLDQGLKVNDTHNGLSPLMLTVCYNEPQCTAMLLKAGADPNFNSILNCAVSAGYYENVQLLINAGAEVDNLNDQGVTPLITAIQAGRLSIVDLLVDSGCNLNIKTRYKTTALIEAINMRSVDMVDILVRAGADLNLPGTMLSIPPLQLAMQLESWDVCEMLIHKGANPNIQSGFFQTAIQKASYEGEYELVKTMIANGADVNLGWKPRSLWHSAKSSLHLALEGRHYDLVKALITAGANVNQVSGCPPYTPLERAAELDHLELVKQLLMAGANPNHGGESIPLLSSASRFVRADNTMSYQSASVIGELLAAGADPRARNNTFLAPIRVCTKNNIRYRWWNGNDPIVLEFCKKIGLEIRNSKLSVSPSSV